MDFFNNIIKDELHFNNQNDKALNIAFGIDQKFSLGVGVCITSIIQNNLDEYLSFHIFSEPLPSSTIKQFEQLATLYPKVSINIYTININRFDDLPTIFTWSKAIYYRFVAGYHLTNIKKFLYLDADILCLSSLKELFLSLSDDKIAAVIPDSEEMVSYAKKNFNFLGKIYFNSGVMLINTENWNKNNISQKAISKLLSPNSYKLYDQDVLNVLLYEDIFLLPKKYNYIYHLIDMNQNIPLDTILLHYSGSVKPWQQWGQFHFLTKKWLYYKAQSPFKNIKINEPSTYKEAKFMARTMKKLHNYPAYFKWLFYYGFWKLKTKLK